jgi:hypothetical protein
VSRPRNIDLATLRVRLQSALDHKQDLGLDGGGSLYLRALCCLYLACEEPRIGAVTTDEEHELEKLLLGQCATEVVDAEELLTEMCLVQALPGGAS